MKKSKVVAALLVSTGISIIGCTGSSGGENKYALDFDGEDDLVQTSLAANSDFVTVTAWVKVTGRNGEKQAESFAADGVITDSELAVTIGANPDPWHAEGFTKFFTGTIDEISIWNVALTEQSIQNIMHRTLDSSENGLIGYWRFEEGEGQVSEDMSVNGNDAQLGPDPDTVDIKDPIWTENCAPMF
jgi:hypothetical protein